MHDIAAQRKARGAFFTPPAMSTFLAEWALRHPQDSVLEPSCGEASLLLAAGERLRQLGATAERPPQLHGIELHQQSADQAIRILSDHGLSATVEVKDFFDVAEGPLYDAVLGNPPYVRFQQFSGNARARGLEAALRHGVRLSGLSSSWAAFTVHAAQFLKPGGRLGLVLPAELLAVSYAAGVRRFLLNRFKTVRLVMFEELVFPGVLEEVVLLLAEGEGPGESFEVFQAKDLAELTSRSDHAWSWFTPQGDAKWTPALLQSSGLEAYQNACSSSAFETLSDWGQTYLGAVTGDNKFFGLTAAEVRALGLKKKDVRKISPAGSRHLRGLTFSDDAWEALEAEGKPCYLFYPPSDVLSEAAQNYVTAGEAMGVSEAYKCRVRKPWWKVPTVAVPDLLMTYMDHERPRFATNDAAVLHLNSLYGVRLHSPRKVVGRDLLPLALLNSVTMLGGEMVGRAYGGGLLKLEPREADKLPVPSLAAIEAVGDDLRLISPQVQLELRRGRTDAAVALVDRVLLTQHLGMSHSTLKALRDARTLLFTRRVARGKGAV